MRQFTTPDQTAKLIELGFAPNTRIKEVQVVHSEIHIDHYCYFAIGDLIEMLPQVIEFGEKWGLRVMPTVGGGWRFPIVVSTMRETMNSSMLSTI